MSPSGVNETALSGITISVRNERMLGQRWYITAHGYTSSASDATMEVRRNVEETDSYHGYNGNLVIIWREGLIFESSFRFCMMRLG